MMTCLMARIYALRMLLLLDDKHGLGHVKLGGHLRGPMLVMMTWRMAGCCSFFSKMAASGVMAASTSKCRPPPTQWWRFMAERMANT